MILNNRKILKNEVNADNFKCTTIITLQLKKFLNYF